MQNRKTPYFLSKNRPFGVTLVITMDVANVGEMNMMARDVFTSHLILLGVVKYFF